MKRKDYFLLYLLSTVFFSILTFIIQVPGYMDAEYYYAGGIQIFSGNPGLEPFIWNYLNSPHALPTTSFSYWMPLTSIISAMGMFLFRSTGFYAGRLLFVLLAGLIPVLSARFAEELSPIKGSGWLAGFVAIFSVYYLPYFTLTDSFTPFMLLGGAYILIASRLWKAAKIEKKVLWWVLAFGIVAGLLNLTRTEGIIWFGLGIGIFFISYFKDPKAERRLYRPVLASLVFLIGFLVIMSSWYARNLSVFGSILPPGSRVMLWSINYDDIFYYTPDKITPARFFAQGAKLIIQDRLFALGNNLKSLLGVNGSIILAPLMVIGLWKTRKRFVTRLTVLMTLIMLVVMSFVFPYAGFRGGFLHSNSVIQTVLWGMVPLGLSELLDFGVKHRNWKKERAWKMFGITVIMVTSILSGFILIQKMSVTSENEVTWNKTLTQFNVLDDEIVRVTQDEDSVIMVNDPPGYYLATERKAIVNPSDSFASLLAAASEFNARYCILDKNNVRLMDEIGMDANLHENIKLIAEIDGSKIYEIIR